MTTQQITPNPIINYPNGTMNLTQVDNPWDWAVDCVNYPVYIKPLYFYHPEEATEDGREPVAVLAEGVTNTLRDVEFYGVVVDRSRTDELSTIATVTGMYDTIPAAEVFLSLKSDLEDEGIKALPYDVYVSGNGGRHQLRILIEDMDWVVGEIDLSLILNTSVDGKSKHHIRLAPVDRKTGIEIVGIGSDSFNVSARHTQSIREHHASFTILIQKLIKEWDEMVIPTMNLMNDCKFDKKFAVEVLENLAVAANLPERHADKAIEFYSGSYSDHSLYNVFRGMSEYLGEELNDKPERLQTFKDSLSKRSDKIIRDTLEKMKNS